MTNQPDEAVEKEPTKEEILEFYNEQIEIKSLQLKLQQINRDYAIARFEETLAITKLAQLTAPPPKEEEEAPEQQRSLKKK